MKFYTLGNSRQEILEKFPEKVVKKVRLGNLEIGMVRIDDLFFGFELYCPHRGASLLSASLNGNGELICPLHEYRFNLEDGQVRAGQCRELKIFPCSLSENGLSIQVP